MLIEINSPACLPLGLARMDGKSHLLGITLKYPPVNLFTRPHAQNLKVTGARADKAYAYAERFLQHHQQAVRAEIGIERAIPNLMGLSSEVTLGLSVARTLAVLYQLPHETPELARAVGLGAEHALAAAGFNAGGLLLVDVEPGPDPWAASPALRQPITHPDQQAWVFVFYFPRPANDVPKTLEADRLAELIRAAPHLSAETGRMVRDTLWPAVEKDDLVTFARALMALRQLNDEALAQGDAPPTYSTEEQSFVDLIRESGAPAWGRALTGLALFGLVRGADASLALRKQLQAKMGYFGGTVMASVTDNQGARHVVRESGGEPDTSVDFDW